jgi:hypothetical protein
MKTDRQYNDRKKQREISQLPNIKILFYDYLLCGAATAYPSGTPEFTHGF